MNSQSGKLDISTLEEDANSEKPLPLSMPIGFCNVKDSILGNQLKDPAFYGVLSTDALIFVLAHFISYLIRFEFALTSKEVGQILVMLPLIVPLKLISFYCFGIYRSMCRYMSSEDIWQLLHGVIFTTLIIFTTLFFIEPLRSYPRAVFLLDGLLTFLFAVGIRSIIQTYIFHRDRRSMSLTFFNTHENVEDVRPTRTLIVGGGDAGARILQKTNHHLEQQYNIIGFLDDDIDKLGRSIYGRRILGTVNELQRIVNIYKIELILIAIPSDKVNGLNQIVQSCEEANVKYLTFPSLTETINGKMPAKNLKKIDYQGLLKRESVELDRKNISNYLSNTTVLITGCGGSIGSELCRQILQFHPGKLILIDASEENLFNIHSELQHDYHFRRFQTILARVQNRSLLEKVFEKYRPDVVFHAAANKHVPIMEINPWEAVYNNIQASFTAMELAIKHNVKRFVLVSTSKAVNPENVMGASKRVAELLLQSFQGRSTKFMAVRFGNVIGSSGSAIPLFERQLKNGGPITVTHPEITRYFMTIPESAQLILQAGCMGKGGEIFILNMGKPIKIVNLAKKMIRLSGKEPGKDVKIIFTGLRKGEKLHEELKMKDENELPTVHKKIMMLKTHILGFKLQYFSVHRTPSASALICL